LKGSGYDASKAHVIGQASATAAHGGLAGYYGSNQATSAPYAWGPSYGQTQTPSAYGHTQLPSSFSLAQSQSPFTAAQGSSPYGLAAQPPAYGSGRAGTNAGNYEASHGRK
jgi:hypothetical protein